jgi:hypothetical protein
MMPSQTVIPLSLSRRSLLTVYSTPRVTPRAIRRQVIVMHSKSLRIVMCLKIFSKNKLLLQPLITLKRVPFSDIICHKFKRKGHYANRCTNRAEPSPQSFDASSEEQTLDPSPPTLNNFANLPPTGLVRLLIILETAGILTTSLD